MIKKDKKQPGLRFPGFTDDWELRKFEDIFSVSQGLQIPIKDRFTEDGNNRYFYITNEFLKDSCSETYYIESPSESVICNEEDILMTRTGNTGIIVTDVNGCFHNNFFKIKYDKTVFSKRFICYLLSSPMMQKIILNSAGSSTIPDLSHKNFYKISSRFPCSKNEQNSVGNFLFHLDHLITLHQRKCDQLELLKKGLMQKLFSQEVRFKADDGSEFPEWEEKKLGDVCEYGKGQSVGINYVGTENMNQNFSGVDSLDSTNEVNGMIYCVGDTLMSNIRPYLKKTWKADRNGVCSTDVLVFRPVNIDSDFLYYNISSEKFVLYVMTGVKGSKMPRGDKGHIMEYDMPIPCLTEQQKIADCLSSLDEVIKKQKATLTAWKELKKGLLQQMFV